MGSDRTDLVEADGALPGALDEVGRRVGDAVAARLIGGVTGLVHALARRLRALGMSEALITEVLVESAAEAMDAPAPD
jgi:hypothetical protein